MIAYIVKKLGYGVLILFGVLVTVFLLFNVMPDPSKMVAGQRSDLSTDENIRKELGYDKPMFTQFLLYINDVSPLAFYKDTDENKETYSYSKLFTIGNTTTVIKTPYFRRSFQSKKKVSEILGESFVGTLVLAFSSILIAGILGILLGVLAAIKQNSFMDNALIFLSTLGISLPSFFVAIILSWLFGFLLTEYTGLNMTGSLYDYDPINGETLQLRNLILPAIALGIRPLAIITQLTRSSMLDVMSQDYIRTALAKGLSYPQVIKKHALRNALNPVITAISGWFASLLAGAFFVEYIFNWKGLGKVTINALEKSDFPVVMGAVIVIATIFIVINILVDILYTALDPRVKLNQTNN